MKETVNLNLNTNNEKKSKEEENFVQESYNYVLNTLKKYGFEVATAEAVFLKQIVRDVYLNEPKFEEAKKQSLSSTTNKLLEASGRFFWQFHGVDFLGYRDLIKEEYREDAIRDFFKYVQEKLRKDRELI